MKGKFRVLIIEEETSRLLLNQEFDDMTFNMGRGLTAIRPFGSLTVEEMRPNGTFSLELKATNLGGARHDEASS